MSSILGRMQEMRSQGSGLPWQGRTYSPFRANHKGSPKYFAVFPHCPHCVTSIVIPNLEAIADFGVWIGIGGSSERLEILYGHAVFIGRVAKNDDVNGLI